MPTRLANHRVENRLEDFLHPHPVIADGLPERIQMVRENARFAQENGMKLHACALLEVTGAATWLESDAATESCCAGAG